MTHKIDGYKSPATLAAPRSVKSATADKSAAPDPAETAAGDQLTLTASARNLQKISEAIANAPVIDTAKVDAVKLAIGNGTYSVDSGRVADKILQFEHALK